MITNKENKNNGEIYKLKRSISSKTGNEVDNENNNNIKIKSRHRKTASSYFLDSLISGNELNKFLQDSKEENNDNTKKFNNEQNRHDNLNNEKKGDLNYSIDLSPEKDVNDKIDNQNDNNNDKIICLTNASFYSYSVDENNENNSKDNIEEGSVLIKDGNKSSNCNNENKVNSEIVNNNSNFFSNNPFYELEKNKEKYGKDKSFIPIKNGLKYMKDKEERVTDSYLLALNSGESNIKKEKTQYLLTASIIEEERSEFIESTSKKQPIIANNILAKDMNFKKKKILNEFNLVKNEKDNIVEKSEDYENKENIDINIKKNIENKSEVIKKNSKKFFDINIKKIKVDKNKKIEIKKKCIRKNKENLLNSFYNLSCNRSIQSSYNSKLKEENGSDASANTNTNTQKSNKRNNNKNKVNSNISNFNLIVKEKINKDIPKNQSKLPTNLNNKKKRTFSYNGGYISYLSNQRFNTENNINNNTNDKFKFNISKFVYQKNNKNIIYNIYNDAPKDNVNKKNYQINKAINKSYISKIKLIPHFKIPNKNFDKSKINIISKNICPSKKKVIDTSKNNNSENKILLDLSKHKKSLSISKRRTETNSKHKKVLSTCGDIDNKVYQNYINVDKGSNLKKPTTLINYINANYENKNNSEILNKRNKQIINYLKENLRLPINSDSSLSRIKQKITHKIINNYNKENTKIRLLNVRKANSGFLKVNLDSDIENKCEFNINISNKNQTFIILKDKILFKKINEKNDVLAQIQKNLYNNDKENLIILCEKNNDNFIFCGIFRYNENIKRFVKLYGNEEIPNHILIKDINKTNYNLYESKIIKNEENKIYFFFEPLKSFYFSFNAIIICKK